MTGIINRFLFICYDTYIHFKIEVQHNRDKTTLINHSIWIKILHLQLPQMDRSIKNKFLTHEEMQQFKTTHLLASGDRLPHAMDKLHYYTTVIQFITLYRISNYDFLKCRFFLSNASGDKSEQLELSMVKQSRVKSRELKLKEDLFMLKVKSKESVAKWSGCLKSCRRPVFHVRGRWVGVRTR
jgi:hypothetical protein